MPCEGGLKDSVPPCTRDHTLPKGQEGIPPSALGLADLLWARDSGGLTCLSIVMMVGEPNAGGVVVRLRGAVLAGEVLRESRQEGLRPERDDPEPRVLAPADIEGVVLSPRLGICIIPGPWAGPACSVCTVALTDHLILERNLRGCAEGSRAASLALKDTVTDGPHIVLS